MPQDKNLFADIGNPRTVPSTKGPTTRPTVKPTVAPAGNLFDGVEGIPTTNPFSSPTKTEEVPGTFGRIVSTIAPVLDVLSRGQYASAKFFDSVAGQNKPIFESLLDGLNEGWDPKERKSFHDVIKLRNPDFVQNNPKSAAVVGFLGDVMLDPTTYLGVGLGKSVLKIGGKALTKVGVKALKEEIGKQTGKTVLEGIVLRQEGGFALRQAMPVEEKVLRSIFAVSPATLKQGKGISVSTIRKATDMTTAELDDVILNLADNNLIRIAASGPNDATITFAKQYKSLKEPLQELGIVPDVTSGKLLNVETIRNAGESARSIFREMNRQEVRATAETLISTASHIDRDVAKRYFKSDNLRLSVGLFTNAADIPGSETLLRAVGLNSLYHGVKGVSNYLKLAATRDTTLGRAVDVVSGTFNRFTSAMPKEYVAAAKSLENQFDYIAGDVIRTTRKMFEEIPKDRREYIGDLMHKIDDASRIAEEKLGRELTGQEAIALRRQNLDAAKLSDTEFATVSRMYQDYKAAGELEVETGLLKHMLQNYTPRMYTLLKDPEQLAYLHQAKYGLRTNIQAGKARDFYTHAEAVAEGFVPELDAAVTYAQRMMQSRRAMAAQHFRESVDGIFGVKGFEALPDRIKNDIKLMGESIYPMHMNSDARGWLSAIDTATSVWRRFATVAKPGFAPKQVVSNSIQAAMVQGVRAFKLFDPRSAIDAAMLVMDRTPAPKVLPDFFRNIIKKTMTGDAVLAERLALTKIGGLNILEDHLSEAASKFELTNVLGERYTGKDLVELARKHNIIRGFDSTGDRFTKHLQDSISFNERSGWSVTKELSKWWNHAAVAEDYGRMMTFINGVRMGHSVEDAVNITNKALFDYAHGLSAIEKNVAKRVLPFYTFQRFAIPFVAQTLVTKPGGALTVDKTFKLFEKLLVSGESLTEEQRGYLPGFILEQPRLFKGFDKEGKATFNLLSNLSPIEAIALMKHDKAGDVDFARTAQATVFAALTPFLKIPAELALNRNFFTDQAVEKAGRMGDIDSNLGRVLPQPIKDMIGWEVRNDSQGNATVYINPYLAHASLSAFPALKTFIKPFDAETSLVDGLTEVLTGVSTVKVDLKRSMISQQVKARQEAKELMKRMRSAKVRGALNEFETAREQYTRLMESFKGVRQSQTAVALEQTGTTPDAAIEDVLSKEGK